MLRTPAGTPTAAYQVYRGSVMTGACCKMKSTAPPSRFLLTSAEV
jgi:hypothetical protein